MLDIAELLSELERLKVENCSLHEEVISYISQGWGGRTSDICLMEKGEVWDIREFAPG
eukprot:m.250149 g.250149  ORF g.250149 m.250149 type:complete len:58 (+) comp40311_c0_seq1:584-757(+)